jgi:hypothetical protein
LENKDGLWKEMIRAKYVKNNTLTQCRSSPARSHFLSAIIAPKDNFIDVVIGFWGIFLR